MLRYVTAPQRASSAAAITAACYLGALLSNLLAPQAVAGFGWEACFYAFALLPPLLWVPQWVQFSALAADQSSDLADARAAELVGSSAAPLRALLFSRQVQ